MRSVDDGFSPEDEESPEDQESPEAPTGEESHPGAESSAGAIPESPFTSEARIRELLAAQPRPQMPTAVRERILAALAAEPQPDFTATPGNSSATGGSKAWWTFAAVAAAFVLLVGVVFLPRSSEPPATTIAGEQAPSVGDDHKVATDVSCGGQPLTYESGTRYVPASFTDQAQDLAAYCSAEARSPVSTQNQVRPTEPTRDPVPAMSPSLALRSMRCVIEAAPTADVMVVDRGYYGTDPATIAVVGPPSRALVIDCQDQPERVVAEVGLD